MEMDKVYSDSASLGSNPSPPATKNPHKSQLFRSRQIGNPGTEGGHRTDNSRHRAIRRIKRLFDSRVSGWGFGARNIPEAYHVAADRWLAGEIIIKPHRIDQHVLAIADRDRAERYSQTRSEGELSHCWLKEIGLSWLDFHYNRKAERESRAFGWRYDLALSDKQVIVECGNTSIQAALDAVGMLDWEYFLLPFSAAADAWFEGDRIPHVFIFEIKQP
jgi:hypothetical protein